MNYLLMADIHFHNWTSFSTINESGVNSRLQIIMDEILRATEVHEQCGGDKILVIAGDVFHTRGAVQTSVLNPVMDLFTKLSDGLDYKIHILSGNHDLESKDSMRVSSSVTALENCGVNVYSEIEFAQHNKMVMVPWFSSVADLKEALLDIAPLRDLNDHDLIIHAPIDDVIVGLPSHGLDAAYLSKLGFKRVFSGHYHNHKDFGNGVWSIGATTHQTFSDIGSKAGFLSVFADRVVFHASHAPRFVDINADNFDDAELLVDGNYVRCRINNITKESDIAVLREEFGKWGARGVIINQVKGATVTAREGAAVTTETMSLESSIAGYIAAKGYDEQVEALCLDILNEAGEVE
ncbi:MAG: metallophosphoesterase [Methylobacter sp.]